MINPEKPIFNRSLVALHLANSDAPAVRWDVFPDTRVSLDYKSDLKNGHETRYYVLSSLTNKGERYLEGLHYVFYADDGRIAGVVRNEVEGDDRGNLLNGEEVISASNFQIKNELIAPLPDDEVKLDRLLEAGLDNPTFIDRRQDES